MDFDSTISGIFFIQSLRPGDAKTGRDVHLHVQPILSSKSMFCEPSVRDVVDARGLFDAFKQVRDTVKSQRLHPALQLDAHGSVDGLQVASGEVISWNDLAGPLREINDASENTLLLCSAACHGGHLARIAMSHSAFLPSPYWGVLGPMQSLKAGDLQDACQRFWTTLLAKEDAPGALRAFNAVAGPMAFVQCEMLFARIWMRYVCDMLDDPDGLEARVARIFKETNGRVTSTWIRDRLCSLPSLEAGYREMHTHYLWLDKYAKHRDRYQMTFADACRMFPNG